MSADHPEIRPIFRSDVVDSVKQPRVTRGYFTKYEYTSLVAIRAQQLADGAKPLIELTGIKTSDPMFVWTVAKREIELQKLPFIIRRQLPDGSSEFWNAQDMEINW
jgi:DNA-directed RNA polymerase I, II, and III subunit RPABC2